ncbi:hypothetical protein [Pseudoalteromonas luteoviolacea]|uniref:hypothetical protein n=1 Tax=Pseudoalteromonas luteoviolacea TaxID=43657 RepID=UPI001B394B78|nr:hypothetical protein [Pseudoalteromonas luteoviolacea]MBQ4835718.1 hypothetical protein [Pseudoalteromonas luteoviolacea]
MSKKVKYIISFCLLVAIVIKFGPILWGIYLIDKSKSEAGGGEVFTGLVTVTFKKVTSKPSNQFDLGFLSIGLPDGFVDDKLDEFKPTMHSFSAETEESITISDMSLEDMHTGYLVSNLKHENTVGIDFINSELGLFLTLTNLNPDKVNVLSSLLEVSQMVVLLKLRSIFIYGKEKEFYYFRVDDHLEAIQLVEKQDKGRILLFHNKNWLAEIYYQSLTQESLNILLSNIQVK